MPLNSFVLKKDTNLTTINIPNAAGRRINSLWGIEKLNRNKYDRITAVNTIEISINNIILLGVLLL